MRALYVPERFAHGYQVLMDNSDASYEMSACYTPSAEGGLPHDDPRLQLPWALPVTVISAKDRNFRPLAEIEDELKRRMLIGPTGARHAKDALASI
jgi:dTDP-4-dehydrorhamnose 3,5-epimerase